MTVDWKAFEEHAGRTAGSANASAGASGGSTNGASHGPELQEPLIKTAKDFLTAFTKPSYVLQGILVRGFLYALTAMTGAGKTAVALCLSYLIAYKKETGARMLGPHRVKLGTSFTSRARTLPTCKCA